MKLPLETRVHDALKLQPMTVKALSRCLGANLVRVNERVSMLAAEGSAIRVGIERSTRGGGRRAVVWGLVA